MDTAIIPNMYSLAGSFLVVILLLLGVLFFLKKVYGIKQNKKLNDISELYSFRELLETYCQLFAPMAPHLAEECWKIIGCNDIISQREWPQLIEKYIQEDTVLIVVQVNGKKRGEIEVAKGLSQNEVETAAMKIDNVSKSINSEIRKIIYVPNRILNVVI